MVEQHYNESRAVSQEPQPVGFDHESDSITLDIPDDGVHLKGGWTIKPLMHPAVGCTCSMCMCSTIHGYQIIISFFR